MQDFAREKLTEIIRIYGQAVVDDPRRLASLLHDLCPGNVRETNLIVSAVREQIPAKLRASPYGQPFDVIARHLSKQLCDELGVTDKAARWTVESWALALGRIPASQISNIAARTHFETGNTLLERQQFVQAAAEYEESVRLDPEYTEAYNNLGIALVEQDELAAATEAFRESVRLDPEDAESQSNLGNALLCLNRHEEAVRPLREALRLDPDAPDVQDALERALHPEVVADPSNAAALLPAMPGSSTPLLSRSAIVTTRRHNTTLLHTGKARQALAAAAILILCILLYHAHSASRAHVATAALKVSPAAQDITAKDATPDDTTPDDTTPDEETQFPVQWGQYTIVRSDETDDTGSAQQKVSILDADGQTLWSKTNKIVWSAKECDVTGSATPDLEITLAGGGNDGDGTEFFFSDMNGLHSLFSIDTTYQGILRFERINNDQRPGIVFYKDLAFFDGLSHHGGGEIYCIYRWNGSKYMNATREYPQPSQEIGLQAQARYLKNWQTSPAVDYNAGGGEDEDRADAINFWANFMAIGRGNEAKIWLLQHANAGLRAHLLELEPDIRKEVPMEGTTLDATMGDGTILDKTAVTTSTPPASDSTATNSPSLSPEADTSAGSASTISPVDDAAESLETVAERSAPVTAFSKRDTMAAYAPAGSGLSDVPIGPERLQNTLLTTDDLKGKSLRALSISHNTIFARHGYVFERASVQNYFAAQPWYRPNPAFTIGDLSASEQKNVETIRMAEHTQFHYGPPATLRWSSSRDPVLEVATPGSGLNDHLISLATLQNRQISDTDLAGRSLAALTISYNAIYAAHGYTFKRESLQRIFGSTTWYHPNPAFAESDLSETEKSNLRTIRAYERQRFGY